MKQKLSCNSIASSCAHYCLKWLHYNRGGEPIYYHGPREFYISAGGQ